MRWIWIDRFVEFESGARAAAIKTVGAHEEYFTDHLPGFPIVPPSLMIEGMAQTAGILVGEARGFKENVILAKVRRASFASYAHPGDELRYEARIDSIDDRCAMTSGVVLINGETAGHVDLIFSHVDQASRELNLPGHNFVFTDQFKQLLSTVRGEKPNAESRSDA